MTSGEVYECCRYFNSNHDHKFENVFVHDWEADMFSVTSSSYAYEIEVKVSISDFKADFKKPKHHLFKKRKQSHVVIPAGDGWIMDKGIEMRFSRIDVKQVGHKTMPNVFYYACPYGLISAMDIPDYAGLIYCSKEHYPATYHKVIKKAPYLHKDPFNAKTMLFDKYYWGYINQRIELKQMQREIKNLRWQIEQVENTTTEKESILKLT
jgi:hypothetical protein